MSVKVITKACRLKFCDLELNHAFIISPMAKEVWVKIHSNSDSSKTNSIKITGDSGWRGFEDNYEVYPVKVTEITVETTG